jgi:hypothetical protein
MEGSSKGYYIKEMKKRVGPYTRKALKEKKNAEGFIIR